MEWNSPIERLPVPTSFVSYIHLLLPWYLIPCMDDHFISRFSVDLLVIWFNWGTGWGSTLQLSLTRSNDFSLPWWLALRGSLGLTVLQTLAMFSTCSPSKPGMKPSFFPASNTWGETGGWKFQSPGSMFSQNLLKLFTAWKSGGQPNKTRLLPLLANEDFVPEHPGNALVSQYWFILLLRLALSLW